jgi:hypothetical protein
MSALGAAHRMATLRGNSSLPSPPVIQIAAKSLS